VFFVFFVAAFFVLPVTALAPDELTSIWTQEAGIDVDGMRRTARDTLTPRLRLGLVIVARTAKVLLEQVDPCVGLVIVARTAKVLLEQVDPCVRTGPPSNLVRRPAGPGRLDLPFGRVVFSYLSDVFVQILSTTGGISYASGSCIL
jgi:hypothetical protein